MIDMVTVWRTADGTIFDTDTKAIAYVAKMMFLARFSAFDRETCEHLWEEYPEIQRSWLIEAAKTVRTA